MSSELASLIEANTRIDGAFPTPIPDLSHNRRSPVPGLHKDDFGVYQGLLRRLTVCMVLGVFGLLE